MIKLLFISDSNLGNPILFSQGLPLLNKISNEGNNVSILTFEEKENYKYETILNYFDGLTQNKIYFVNIFKNKFLPGWLKKYLFGVSKALNIIKNNNIEIIHCRSFIPAMIGVTIKKYFYKKIKIIFDNRGVFIDEEIYKGNWKENTTKVKYARKIKKWLYINCDIMVVVSNAFKEHIIKSLPHLEKKIKVIGNSTDLEKRFPNISVSKSERIKAVYSGSFAAWQQKDELINLCKYSLAKYENLDFIFITYDNIKLDEYFDKEIIEKRISLINSSSVEVSKYMIEGSFGILLREKSIVNKVASPLKFAEYLACGLPVLVSEEVGDTQSLINNYGVGVVIKENNYEKAIDEIIKLSKKEDIKVRCRETAKSEYNLNTSFEKYINIYNSILN